MAITPPIQGKSRDAGLPQIATPIFVLGAIMGLMGLAGSFIALGDSADLVMVGLPAVSVAACGFTLFRILRFKADFVLVPIVLFVGQALVVSSFGPLVHSFGADQTLNYLAWRPISTDIGSLARALSMSYVAIGLILMSAALVLGQVRNQEGEANTQGGFNAPLFATLVFLFVGAFVRFMIVTPVRWGLVEATLPGIVVDAAMLFDVGIGLLCYIAYSSRPDLKPVFWILLLGNMAFSLLDFAKILVVLPAIIAILFHFVAKRNLSVLLISSAALALLYSQIGPLTTFARIEMLRIDNEPGAAFTLNERIDIVNTYYEDPERAAAMSLSSRNPQAWWTRVNYTQQQAFAMKEFEASRPGESLSGAWMLFIPRAIWPDKPIIYPPGKEFFYAATGRDFSFMAATIYGDMYWQFGWLGVIIFAPLVGLFYAWLSTLSYSRIVNREFVYLPVVLLGMLAALQGAQQYLLNGILATIPVVLIAQFACARLSAMGQQSNRSLKRA